MRKIIRIGTRDSELALWQANKVQRMLNELGYETEIVSIKSTGDIILNKPIYELGITGVFTKNLDIALLNNTIDIAVHSMKDVPTVLPEGIIQAAVLKRANYSDIIVLKDTEEFFARKEATIATGSLRRKAMWLNRFPTHTVVDLRGNVNTRLKKLEDNNWDGAVFAAAGLERIGKRPGGAVNLSWMISAPAQGAIMVASLAEDDYIKDACEQLNHYETEVCVTIEREFLHRLEGGCTAPIGAIAYVDEKTQEVNFKGVLLSKDGKKKIEVAKTAPLNKHRYLAQDCADYVINRGGKQLILDDIDVQEESAARVFSTKSLSESQTKLFHNNIASESSDFIKVRSNRIAPKVVKDGIENVIITSKNGVEALLDNFTKEELNFKNIFCVGRRTKKMIQQKIGPVNHTEKNADRLAEYLSKEMKGNSVTYFCSDLRLDTLSKILTENKIEVNEVEAYKTMYSPELVSESIDGMLFYSPSAVNSYLQKNTTDKVAFCIGASTAKEAQKYFEKVEVAQIPTVESVIELVNLHYVQ
ncbi:hydroxymethylbilane synthase [Flavobacteriaceae bacterium]|nr:hydroxymethylbilane synthase [Flavobacteriaceae bacterium]MDB2418680.1 hydroxymethylbilane synthase [Flavobacteriaceae bacterium]